MVQCVHDALCMMDDVMDLPDKIAGQYREVVCPPSSVGGNLSKSNIYVYTTYMWEIPHICGAPTYMWDFSTYMCDYLTYMWGI